jgi:TonB-dependent receptor-like protein/carboxypeptidase-like protein
MANRFYLLLMVLFLCVTSVYSQQKDQIVITDVFSNVPLEQVFTQIQSDYGVKIFYNSAWVKGTNISKSGNEVPILEFLTSILTPLNMKVDGYDLHNYVVFVNEDFDNRANAAILATPLASASIIQIGNPAGQPGSTATISGYVKDGKDGETIIGATVYSLENQKGTTTNDQGYFKLEIPTGIQRIRISFIGFADEIREIRLGSDGTLDIELFEGLVRLESVTVTGIAPDQNVKSLDMGVEKLSIGTIQKLPRLLGEADVVRSLVLLPGVTTVGEGASGYNVRGGSVGENLILQDGAEVFNSSHLFGFFSAFNPDLIRNVTLYKGGSVPANMGGRLSSILDVQLKEGNFKKVEGNGGIGLMTSRLSLEGPIVKDKTSLLIGGRVSYSDWILNKFNDIDLKQSSANFYDANIKISHEFSASDKIYLSGYTSRDNFSLASDTIFNYGSDLATLKWNHLFSPKVFLSSIATIGNYSYDVEDKRGLNQFSLESSIFYQSGETVLDVDLSDRNKFSIGAKATIYENSQGDFTPGDNSFNLTPVSIPKDKSIESAVFFTDTWEITKGLSLSFGVRYSNWKNVGPADVYIYEEGVPMTTGSIIDTLSFESGETVQSYSGFEPRASLRISLNNSTSLKVSYNKMRQYMHLVSNTVAVTPIDVWQMSNYYIRPAVSDQYSVGLFKNFANNRIETSVEYYYKATKDILDYKGGAKLLLNQTLETDLLQGEGRARGIEFLIKKKSGTVTGWLSYTYSRTELKAVSEFDNESVNRGEWYPANYDKPHDFTAVLDYKVGKRVSFNANFTYSTGRPITAPTSSYAIGQLRSLADYSRRNQFRIPDYHRLDVSLTIGRGFKKARKYKSEWNIAIYNVYGRKNAYSIYFDQSSNAHKLSILGMVPSVSYNFKF